MDAGRIRSKVWRKLVLSPAVIVPTFLGVFGAVGSLAGGGSNPAVTAFMAVAGLAVGVGALVTRWAFRTEAITKRVMDQELAREAEDFEARLDRLDAYLRQDRDPRDNIALRELRTHHRALREHLTGPDGRPMPHFQEVRARADALFESCIISLERGRDLWEAARKTSIRGTREEKIRQREELIQEVVRSAEQLARIADEVRASRSATVRADPAEVARVREELAQSLEVARRVEDRVRTWEREALGTPASSEQREGA